MFPAIMAATEGELYAIAVHETGHAAVCENFGATVTSLVVRRNGAGRITWELPHHSPIAHITVCFAGYVAASIMEGTEPSLLGFMKDERCMDDCEQAVEMATHDKRLKQEGLLTRCMQTALDIISTPETQEMIRVRAEMLTRRRVLFPTRSGGRLMDYAAYQERKRCAEKTQ